MNHVHHDLIVAWAKGAKIEYRVFSDEPWRETNTPEWHTFHLYRIKPEPKPDVVLYGSIEKEVKDAPSIVIRNCRATTCQFGSDNVKFIFDGETGVLKDAQVLAKV